MWSEIVLVIWCYLSGILEKVWEKFGREFDYVLSKEVSTYKGFEVGDVGILRK